MFKKLKERLSILSRDMEDIKTQTKLLEMNIKLSEMKDAQDGIKRLDTVEKKITEFEDSNRNYPNRNTEKNLKTWTEHQLSVKMTCDQWSWLTECSHGY